MSKSFEQLTDEDVGAGGIGAWIPTHDFANMILEGVYQKGQLAGKITALNYDMNAGNGKTVNVRYVSKRSNIQELAGCVEGASCLSSASTTFGDHQITIKMQGDYDVVCDFAIWQATGDGYAEIARAMSDSMAAWRDLQVWSDLCNHWASTLGHTTTVAYSSSRTTDTCCNFSFDIYNAIIDARQELFGNGYNPDTVIIHPYPAAYLYYKENGNAPAVQDYMPLLKYGDDGHIASIAGMKVIEAKSAVSDDAAPTAAGDELAFVIDSRRALGEAWGKRPTFTKDYVPECNNYKMVLWTYWGHDGLDTQAISVISNP